jgi:hypothetical protein
MSKAQKGSYSNLFISIQFVWLRRELDSSLKKLSLSQDKKRTSSTRKKEPIADSWEDDDISSGEDTDRPLETTVSANYPAAPPPTPISPTLSDERIAFFADNWNQSSSSTSSSPHGGARPEKTDAVAKRLIAGALGVRAPKKTEEQKAYEKAIKEKETRKRNAEKEARARAEEEAAKAKASAWED